jgi:hypothetical protein
MKRLAALLLLFASSGLAQQVPATYIFTMHYEREGLPTPEWTFSRRADGTATFSSKKKDGSVVPETTFTLSKTNSEKLLTLLESSNNMQPCEANIKNLANMGQKTITYVSATGMQSRCSFNYTENKSLQKIAEMGLAIAFTQQEGAELVRLHRFDRLGMDREIQILAKAAAQGSAQELRSIAPVLESIMKDELVLERVRTRAARLLMNAPE